MKFIDQIPRVALKRRILVMTPLMVMSPPFAKSILVLSLTCSEPSLVKIRELTFPTLCLKCVLLIKTRWRSSAWALLVGIHQQNQNFTYSSLSLCTLNMNIAFEDIWPKGLNCLTHGRIVYP